MRACVSLAGHCFIVTKHRYSYCFPSGIRNIASGQFYWSLSLGWGQSNLNSEASQVTELMVPLHVY